MLQVQDLTFSYRADVTPLTGLTLSIAAGEIVGLSGRSGSGKSTLGRVLAGYLPPQAGSILIDNHPLRQGWCPVQYVDQSSIFAVDPRWRIGRIVEEGWEPDEETRLALGVSRSWYDRYPHEISGGELQRVALLRVLSPATRYLVADELTAMLDPVTQAEIWTTLKARSRSGLGILAISHSRALLDRIATRQLTLIGGRVVESAPRAPLRHLNHGEPALAAASSGH